jgi:hypothetical protein
MTINASIKSDACTTPYTVNFLRGFRCIVFRGRHLQVILSLGSYFIYPLDNWRKRTNTKILLWDVHCL